MGLKRPYILTIAGFDPSGGAGILADIKTVEQHKCIGMAVQTAQTVQTEDTFTSICWTDSALVLAQLDELLRRYVFKAVKIGLLREVELLRAIVQHPRLKGVKVIWDPVLSASAGHNFDQQMKGWETCLSSLYLITPNYAEMKQLAGGEEAIVAAQKWAKQGSILLTGGHGERVGRDGLFTREKQQFFNPKTVRYSEKHGSGCIFSAALTANIAKGYPLQKAILKAKRYIERALSSNPTLLAYHS